MVADLKETGRMIQPMVKENSFFPTMMYTKATLLTEAKRARGYTHITLTKLDTRANFLMMN